MGSVRDVVLEALTSTTGEADRMSFSSLESPAVSDPRFVDLEEWVEGAATESDENFNVVTAVLSRARVVSALLRSPLQPL